MNKRISWQYDEYRQVGVDYADTAAVAAYDARHARFRDVHSESARILDALAVTSKSVVIEFGTGTGAFAIHAAQRCESVYPIDVSKPILEYVRQRAAKAGLKNIVLCHAGFLTYEHGGAPADAIVTSMALHHLPDFWKGIALARVHGMLKSSGLLYIHDVIFDPVDAESYIPRWIDKLGGMGGAQLRDEIATHVREEFSTFDWILDGLLERAGFRIQSKEMVEGVIGTYLCKK